MYGHKKDNFETIKVCITLISERIFSKSHKKVINHFSNRKLGMSRVYLCLLSKARQPFLNQLIFRLLKVVIFLPLKLL